MKTITRFTDFFYIITEMHITIIMKAHKKKCVNYFFFPLMIFPMASILDSKFLMDISR